MPSEMLLFHKGLSYQARSSLQEPGVLRTCVNISLEKEGEQTLRPKFTKINTTAVGSIHSIYRWGNLLIIGDGTHLRFRDITTNGDFTDMYGSFANSIWRFREFKEFLHGVNGTDEVLIDSVGNCYPASIANPLSAPTGADGAAGNPNGAYALYVTYLITYPNGMTYETGVSPSVDVTPTLDKIEWAAIPVSPYAAYYGVAPTIHRKLYRGPGSGGTLTDIYYVATLANNTTVVYSDDASDATLMVNDVCLVESYEPLPNSHYIEYHYGRAYVIHDTYPNRLVFSEAATGTTASENEDIMPIATDTDVNWDDLRVSGFSGVSPQGLIAWGTNFFIPLKQTWIRKQGNDPDTWSYKKTWAQYGVGAPHTIAICPQPNGIISLSSADGGNPGLCLFNGQLSESFASPKLDYIFQTDMDHDYITNCRGFCGGRYYHLIYPSHDAVAGNPDKWLAIDLRRFPDIRAAYWEDLAAICGCAYDQGGDIYVGTSTGYALKSDTASAETIDVDVETEDRIGGQITLANTEKTLKELKYCIDTDGDDVNLQIIIDGTAATWPDGTNSRTISGSGDEVQVIRSFPTNFRGYTFRVRIYGTGLTTFKLYSPIEMVFDVKV